MAVAAAVSIYGIRHQVMTWQYTQLLRYQIKKLAAAKGTKVLLVGDSSLGNAVDAHAWSRALGEPVLSLALTGAYGYGGTLNMIRRALRTQPVQTVVVFQFVGMLAQPVSEEGAVLTAGRWSDLENVPFTAAWSVAVNLATTVNVLGTFVLGRKDLTASYRAVDYVPQVKPLPEVQSEFAPKTYNPADIRPGHMRFLAAIGSLCARKKLRCLYVHGPLTEAWCRTVGPYVAAANRFVRKAGLTPVEGTPICLPWRETGDTENHVIPALKERYSGRYLDLVKPYLSGNATR